MPASVRMTEVRESIAHRTVRKTIWIYGIAMALIIAALQYLEFKYWIRDLSIEVYIGIVAALFTVMGIWVGLRWTRRKTGNDAPSSFQLNEQAMRSLNLSKRELEVLSLMASGLSNQEIADTLYVSIHTVKSHSSNVFAKLDVKRRTQAIQKAKELSLIA